MTVQTVWLPGPVALVPSGKAVEAAAREQYRSGAPTGAAGLGAVVAEMDRLVRTGMLPARVEGDSRRLVVYTQRHAVSLYLTKYEDAYRLGHLAPHSVSGTRSGCCVARCCCTARPGGTRTSR